MTKSSGLTGFHEYCLTKGLPFVSYRLPGEKVPLTIISNSGIKKVPETNDLHIPGFLMVPFHESHPKLWLDADQTFYGDDFSAFDLMAIQNEAFKKPLISDDQLPEASGKTEYFKKINILLQSIHSGRVNKVVLSRPLLIEFNRLKESSLLFSGLMKALPTAFVYLLSFPGAGTWIGATPELLLKAHYNFKDQNAMISTMALAGTRKTGSSQPWGSKEIDEQQWVAKDISQKLLRSGCTGIEQSEAYTVVAGNVEHLRTDFTAKSNKYNILDLSEQLHPTPAICGWPAEQALELILSVENYDRSYYSGYLGPVNISNQTSLFVNLRCMKIAEKEASLFVGGGITSGSVAENEWEETLIKSRTLLAEIEKIRNLAS